MKQAIGEFDLIAQLTKGASVKADCLSQGVGDDCAVIAGPQGVDWLITTDALVEGVHFKREWSNFYSLGRKAVSVNISDIAAMGGKPRFYLVTLGLPKDYSAADASELYRGMGDAASGALLIGGDTVVNPDGILLSITVIGDVRSGRSVMRGGAWAGDAIFATGSYGGSALGLECLLRGLRKDCFNSFVERHLNPTPRIAEGAILSESGMVSAMIDVSDGLLADFGHIADMSGVGFEISADLVPSYSGLDVYAQELGLDARSLALTGGEEYELLFTVRSDRVGDFEREIISKLPSPVARIGTVVEDSSMRRVVDSLGNDLVIDVTGFDHFS